MTIPSRPLEPFGRGQLCRELVQGKIKGVSSWSGLIDCERMSPDSFQCENVVPACRINRLALDDVNR
jgi:hypothetical protein